MAPESKQKKDPRAWNALTPPLAEWILDATSSFGFERMTPVQASVIPLFSANKDVVVEAVTGSGKTLAYLVPLCQRILRLDEPTKRNHVAAIVVSPTRELATQIHKVLLSLLAFHPTSAEILPTLSSDDLEKRTMTSSPAIVPQLLVGGGKTTAQDLQFFLQYSPNIIISTPGRLVELLASPHVHATQSTFEALVLDEADRLLDLGFKPDLQRILERIPKQRRTGLFSASVSEAVGEIIRVGLRNPVKIAVKVKSAKTGGVIEERRTPASLQMTYLKVPASQKLPALNKLLESLDPRPQKSIVFLSTCSAVDYYQHILPELLPEGFSLIPLHGKYASHVRDKNFTRFMNSTSPTVLITTDVAARGLDFPQVDLSVQVDPPSDPKVFIHRSGRAGRAGRKGLSVVFIQPEEADYVPFMDIRQTPIAPLTHPDISVSPEEAHDTTTRIRNIVRQDRALHDKAQKAFVSWLRSYSKHTASSIFRVPALDWTDLGLAWGLLRLPKMPELRSFKGDKFLGVDDVDFNAYAYKDKAREKQRLESLEEYLAANKDQQPSEAAEEKKRKRTKNAEAWSEKHEREGVRSERREKRHKRSEAKRRENMTEEEKASDADLQTLLAQVRRENAEKLRKEQAAEKAAAGGGGGGGGGGDDEFEGFD